MFLAWVAIIAVAAAQSGTTLTSRVAGNEFLYALSVNGVTWLESGDVAFHVDGQWFSAAKNTLKLVQAVNTTGSDVLGPFSATLVTWNAGSEHVFTTTIKSYATSFVFEQVWVTGGSNTAAGSPDDVLSSFPSFSTAATSVPLGVVGWYGTFINNAMAGPNVGAWPKLAALGREGGVNAVFDAAGRTTLVVSALSQFMTASFAGTLAGQISAGLLGSVTSVPAGFNVSFIVSADSSAAGLNNAMGAWGRTLLQAYAKSANGPASDAAVTNLGYNTDHGAFYYYNPEPGKDYLATLLDVHAYAVKENIPYRWVLLDSWWYFKGVGDGVKNWTAMPSVFAGGDAGIKSLVDQTGWPVVGHNRYWSSNTDYAIQNGGKFNFSDNKSAMVVPLDISFWRYLLSTSKAWGLQTYEQDWLYNEFNGVPLLTQSATQARQWLMDMGQAALELDLTVQYCMAYPRHALQSVEIPAVTQIRVSDDYVPNQAGSQNNWQIGASSILAHALALAPFKDNFWTTVNQPGSSCGKNAIEPAPAREAAVSTLSAGPVTPSDGIGFSDAALILRSCGAAGQLMQPSRPAVMLDAVFVKQAFSATRGPVGQVWTTYSDIAGAPNATRWDHIFATKLQSPFLLLTSDLTLDSNTAPAEPLVAYSLETVSLNLSSLKVQEFNSVTGIALRASTSATDFELWHTAPVFASGWALLGDLTKWVPVAAARFAPVDSTDPAVLSVTVHGAPLEVVTVSFFETSRGRVVVVTCTFGSTGAPLTASVPAGQCQ